jgi:membrane peptidoglycan carboxypeptidase
MQLHELNRILIRRGQRKAAAARRTGSRLKPVGFAALLILSLVIAAGIIGAAGLYSQITIDLPPVQAAAEFFDPQNGLILQPSRLYDRSGQTELFTLDNPASIRAYVWLDPGRDVHFSPVLASAVTALTQPDFWESSGADWSRWDDPSPRTIAERLVERLLLWDEEPSARRAVRMRLLATQMTSQYGRERVLEWYLNSASFGRRVTGAESAARVYFGKSSAEVSNAEIALLAGLAGAPALNPHDSPQAAIDLAKSTMQRLVSAGVFSADEGGTDVESQLVFTPPAEYPASSSPAFTRLALQQLSALVTEDRAALGGLQIRTTLDLDMQTQLDCVLKAQIVRLEASGTDNQTTCAAARLLPALPPLDEPLPAGVMAAGILMDPARGEILALSGLSGAATSTDVYENLQGGTMLNPFLAAAAFSRGYSPASLVWDIPEDVDPDTPLLKVEAQDYRGPLRLRTALISDRLIPLEGVLNQLGAGNVWRLARPLGFSRLENVPEPEKLLEGGPSVSLLEVAQGITVFANLGDMFGLQTALGSSLQPSTLLQVEDSYGNSLLASDPIHRQSVLSAPLAYLVHHVMADENLRRSELGYPNPFELGRPAGAKFGSADGGREIWAAGYTPQRSAVIWMGVPEGSAYPSSLGYKAVGGVWNAVMRHSLQDLPAADWSMPPGVSQMDVCDPSGLLPTRICPSKVTEVFLQGSEPNSVDDLYREVTINRETGRIATVFTPPSLLEESTFLSVPEFARKWALAAGKTLPPTDYDTIQSGNISENARITSPELFSLVNGTVKITGSATGEGFQDYRLQIGEGLNPRQWVEIAKGSEAVKGEILGEWDTAGRNGLYAIRLLVVGKDNRIETALSQVTVDSLPPVITLISPLENSAVSGARPIFIQADVSDTSAINKVTFSIDGRVIGESTRSPFTVEWDQPLRGKHLLTVTAEDTAGNRSESAGLSFVVE